MGLYMKNTSVLKEIVITTDIFNNYIQEKTGKMSIFRFKKKKNRGT